MSDDQREAIDTIAMAGLLKAVQILHERATQHPEACARAIEAEVLVGIKQLDADDFDYELQSEGLGEALDLVQTIFRHARARRAAGIAATMP